MALDPKKRKVSTFDQFQKDAEKSEKAKHVEKGEHEIVDKSMSGDVKGEKGVATLDESLMNESFISAIQEILTDPTMVSVAGESISKGALIQFGLGGFLGLPALAYAANKAQDAWNYLFGKHGKDPVKAMKAVKDAKKGEAIA